MAEAPQDDPEAASGPPVGTVLEGRYRLVDQLGEGGVGWVYRAEHLKLGTEVAIKMLQAPYAQHEMLRPRFEREAKALASLRHPHIVTLTDYSVAEDGHPYLVMERLEGRTLADLMDDGPMEEGRARRILHQILDALIYAHDKGFAHRDLKPTNIFLVELPTDPDHVKILDFGFVKLLGGDRDDKPALTRSGIAFGTPSYMCPEQATGGTTDPRADLYSAGVVLFEMLAGRRPYIGEIPDIIRQHLTEPVPPLDVGGHPIAAGPELRELLERAMAKEPADRFQSAREMRDALDALPTPSVREIAPRADGKAETIPAPPPARTPAEPTRPATPSATAAVRRRQRVKVFPILAGLVVAGGAAALAFAIIDEDGAGVVPGADRGAVEGPANPESVRSAPDRAGDGEEGTAPVEGEGGEAVVGDDALAVEGGEDPVDWDAVTGTDDLLYGDEGEAALGETTGDGTEPVAEGDGPDLAEGAIAEDSLGEDAAGDQGAVPADTDEGVSDSPPSADARDPWATREPVPLLDEAREHLRTGRPLPRDDEQQMRRFVRDHRDDPRAHLVLARHFLARGHTLSAVQRYGLAYAVDPAARHDPDMLDDLVRLARLPVASEQAADIMARAYGAAAIAPVEAALADASLDAAERRRLEAVRDRLRGGS